MNRSFSAAVLAGLFACVAVIAAQDREEPKGRSTVELTGCVSVNPSTTGQFSFVDGASGGTYRLNGKGVRKYAGQRVTLVGDTSKKRVRVRFGLWPSPNVAARAGAMDPAQESIARQPGGSASAADANLPELRVVRMRSLDGACG